MDAPLGEELTRLLLAILTTVVFGVLVYSLRVNGERPGRLLTMYLAGVVGANALWRWFVLWLGAQAETPDYVNIEPVIRTVGNWLLALLYVAIGLTAWFHARQAAIGRRP